MRNFRIFGVALLAIAVAVSCCSPLSAQQNPPPPPNPPPGDEPIETLKVDVNVVSVFFTAKDKHGRLVPDLKRDDFLIEEEGKPQTIKYFTAESNLPLTLGILIDTSVSMERMLGMERVVGAEFLREILKPKDLAFLISFDVNVDLMQDFTNSSSDLRAALDRTRINSGGNTVSNIPGLGGGPIPGGQQRGTLLYDAVYLAAREKLGSEVGRKAMILLTDGDDYGSQKKVRDAIEMAQKADTIVYVLLIADRDWYRAAGGIYSGPGEMDKLTRETGGRVIEVGNKPEKLREAFAQIAAELRSQYSIGYTPTNNKHDGGFREIKIKTKSGDYHIQARHGYYARKD